jgi:hypothetical protein
MLGLKLFMGVGVLADIIAIPHGAAAIQNPLPF